MVLQTENQILRKRSVVTVISLMVGPAFIVMAWAWAEPPTPKSAKDIPPGARVFSISPLPHAPVLDALEVLVPGANGVTLQTFSKGNGKTAIVYHPGWGRWAKDFDRIADYIAAAGFKVVSMNPRGIGKSVGPTDEKHYTLRDLGKDVWLVVDHLKLGKVIFFGQTAGQRVMRMASSQRPEAVLGLITLAAGGEIKDPTVYAKMEKIFTPDLGKEEKLTLLREVFFAPANADKAEQWLDGWCTEASRIQKAAGQNVPLEEWWQGGTAPLLILQGLNDKIAPPQNALNLALKRPNTKLIGLPNAGHAMTPEVPEVIAEETIRFARAVE